MSISIANAMADQAAELRELATFYQREWMLAVMGREPSDDERLADWQQRLGAMKQREAR